MALESLPSMSHKQLRSSDNIIFLVGKCENGLAGAKLPSIQQVLKVFFYKIRVEHNTVKQSARYTISLTLEFWKRARIPTQTEVNCIKKLIKIYEEWRAVQKNSSSKFEVHRQKEQEFREHIENFVFDIASSDAFQIMKIEEDKNFLIKQREKGRPGSMAGVDKKLVGKEKRKANRLQVEDNRKQKHLNELAALGRYCNCVVYSRSYLPVYFVSQPIAILKISRWNTR